MNKEAKITICDYFDENRKETRYFVNIDDEEKLDTASASEVVTFLLSFTESVDIAIIENPNYELIK